MFNSNFNSKKRKLTDKEATVLEHQRLVAAKLAIAAAGSTAQGTTTKTSQPKPPPSSKQAAIIQAKNQSETIQNIFHRPDVEINLQKRPSIRSKISPPTTAAAALAQARARNPTPKNPIPSVVDLTKNTLDNKKPSILLTRKATSHLASLVTASMQTTVDSAPSSYGVVDPDDFWKNLRDWDFLTAFVKEVGSNMKPRGTQPQDESNNNNNNSNKKPLPDTFISTRHYIASWAPLCLEECRAQMLSEAMQNQKEVFHAVMMETPKSNFGSAMESVVVICRSKSRGHRNDLQFYANDCVILIPTEHADFVQQCMKKGDIEQNMRKYGLLGHTEHSRKGVDGLQLKVSKKLWAKAGGTEMSILKIGSNITAWREFTALCRVESIPLTRHLLGEHLSGLPKLPLAPITKAQLLDKMGGTSALGKGFTKYADSKFNRSQLMAISAAAIEYGQGGFTLIKGPPGTGK
jgi:hypothetical protein